MSNQPYKSDAMAALHETMADLHQGSVIDDQAMQRFDEICLSHVASPKRLFVDQIKEAMQAQNITKTTMATMLGTSRSQLARILDAECDGVTLAVMQKAASVVGMSFHIKLVDKQ